jgi:hypothetical protein
MPIDTPLTPGRLRVLLVQAAAIVLAGAVLGLFGGVPGSASELPPDVVFWFLAAGHPLLILFLVARESRLFARPLSLLPWLLLPAAVAWLGSAISLGAAPEAAEAASRCDLFLLAGAVSERLRFLGLLSTAALCLGAVFCLEPETPPDPTSGRAWRMPLALAAPAVALSVWAILDPGLPRGVPILDRAVFALWPIPALFAALGPVGRSLREHLAGRSAPRTAARALLALLAVLAGTLAFLSLDRARGLAEGLFAAARPSSFSFPQGTIAPEGAVLRSVAERLLPWAGLLLLVVLGFSLAREKSARRALWVVAAILLGGTVLCAGFEVQYRKGREERCPATHIAIEKKISFRRMPRLCARRSRTNSQRRK